MQEVMLTKWKRNGSYSSFVIIAHGEMSEEEVKKLESGPEATIELSNLDGQQIFKLITLKK
jgi:hypothetical protein